MRKLLMLLTFVAISTISYAQSFYKVERSAYLKYEDGEWIEKKKLYPTQMYIIIEDGKITITNQNNSVYMTIGDYEKSIHQYHTTHTWKAIDKDGDYCTIMLKQSKSSGAYSLSVYYFESLLGFEYNLEQ